MLSSILHSRFGRFLIGLLAFGLIAPVAVASSASASSLVVTVVVKADSSQAVDQAARQMGAEVVGPISGSQDLWTVQQVISEVNAGEESERLTQNLARDITMRRGVEWAVPAGSSVAASPFYAWPFYAWNGAEAAEGEGYDLNEYLELGIVHETSTGRGVTIAVIDTGFEVTHPMIAGHLDPGFDFIDGDTDVTDEPNNIDDDGDGLVDEAVGHGTHLAGVIAQVAPDARILPIRAVGSDGEGSVYHVVSAVEYAIDSGVDVINLSLGTDVDEPALRRAISKAAQLDIAVVAAAGNNGSTDVQYPAGYGSVIGVAAHDPATESVAEFGNFGPWVDVSALGVSVRSAVGDSGVGLLSGSSVATPIVAAQIALVGEVNPYRRALGVSAKIHETADQDRLQERRTLHGEVQIRTSVGTGALAGQYTGVAGASQWTTNPTDPAGAYMANDYVASTHDSMAAQSEFGMQSRFQNW